MVHVYLADLVVAVHVAYVGFVLVGQVLILVGAVLGWQWIRNLWFRLAHLVAIAFVAFEDVIGMECPLTVWERTLRRHAGEAVSEGTFIGQCLDRLLFYDCPGWVFSTMYIGFALLVLATLILVPPRWRRPAASVS
jgi:hypothetical protein